MKLLHKNVNSNEKDTFMGHFCSEKQIELMVYKYR